MRRGGAVVIAELQQLGLYLAEFLAQVAGLSFVALALFLYVRELARPSRRMQ
jgi:hypothetical protein